ncbi:hypothetical protein M0811_05938 [Anaeramoeba ignava]|uniref:Uncharacterized protein n=1 Tax=Anaeramoeba ignava TaxID=1746090 RepID=A0A9Q0LT53_ANAIG|nr:hypothetical protein M0811_05938 [Anaeramoeba ignava]
MKEIWNNIFQQFEIPCYPIYKTKTIKQEFPFSSIIYSIIQQNETISQQNKIIPFIDSSFNDEIIQKYLKDFIKLVLNPEQENIFQNLKINLRRIIKNYYSQQSNEKIETISFQKIQQIYFEKIHQKLINLLFISKLINFKTKTKTKTKTKNEKRKRFSFLLFIRELIEKIKEDKEEIIQNDNIEELFEFWIEINQKQEEIEKEEIEKLYNEWIIQTFQKQFSIQLKQLNPKKTRENYNYQKIENELMINKITNELIEELFSENINYKKIKICKKSQKEKKPIYLCLKSNERKCSICEEEIEENDTKHFRTIRKSKIEEYRKEIINIFHKFSKYLTFYGRIIFQQFLFKKKLTKKFNFGFIQKFLNYLIQKIEIFLKVKQIENIYSIFYPILKNLLSFIQNENSNEDNEEIINFIDEFLKNTNQNILENKSENIILISCIKIINENEEIRNNIKSIQQNLFKNQDLPNLKKESKTKFESKKYYGCNF